ncbi:F-box/kelch-repeat protein At3g06240-like [Vicia villosa]|uniref:F-box/kelch-repeat protein At3g06240-like n=1 Tax=Vicia villosa TaxID=3911 RepID=UPI00273B36AE|nr:F-box/kelch-repeat protein At3g06240-like [Vicia villosa]
MALSNEKLPQKSLSRFKCVRKTWAVLFENPYFLNMYQTSFKSNNSYYNDACVLLKQTPLDFEKHSLLYLLSGERFDNKVKLDWPSSFQDDDHDFNVNILGSGINGILCIYSEGLISKVVLWNPAIDEFRVIPMKPTVSVPSYKTDFDRLYGFGYDYVRDDFKVIRYVNFFTNLHYLLDDQIDKSSNIFYDPLWEIYSLKSNSWRKLDLDIPRSPDSMINSLDQVYVSGMCHWFGESETTDDNLYLVSFDLGNEVVFLTSIPILMDDSNNFELVDTHLMVLNESIALISSDAGTNTFHISILGEIGVKESWNKLFRVGPLPCLGYSIGMGKNNDIFFVKEDEELAMCDLGTHTVQELGIKGVFYCCQVVIYKKSLLSITE